MYWMVFMTTKAYAKLINYTISVQWTTFSEHAIELYQVVWRITLIMLSRINGSPQFHPQPWHLWSTEKHSDFHPWRTMNLRNGDRYSRDRRIETRPHLKVKQALDSTWHIWEAVSYMTIKYCMVCGFDFKSPWTTRWSSRDFDWNLFARICYYVTLRQSYS